MSRVISRGFTLIELITVIIVLGVVSVGIGGFVRTGIDIYGDVSERDQVLSEGRFVIERLNRELRMAVPNSPRLSTSTGVHCLEFVPTKWVTYYTDLPLIPSSSTSVKVVEIVDSSGQFELETGDFALVYPNTKAAIYDLSSASDIKRRSILSCSDSNDGDCATADTTDHLATLTVDGAFAQDSPAKRLYIVNEAISFCVRNKQLYRHSNSIAATQVAYTTGGVLMAENIQNDLSDTAQQPFRVVEASLTRNGLINVFVALEYNEELVNFSNEVHIPNVP